MGAPGTEIAGCSGMSRTSEEHCGLFTWMQGENLLTGEVLSLAVDCKPLGGTLYIPPAVNPVRSLIEEIGEAWSPREINAGEGNLHPIETRYGTYILIRTTTGGYTAEGFLLLPPPVAQAWWGAMVEEKSWLWPTRIEASAHYDLFVIGENGDPQNAISRFTIRYNPDMRVAERGEFAYSFSARKEINTRELEQAALQARS